MQAAYNIVVEFLISDTKGHSACISYLYSGVASALKEGRAELELGADRAKCRIFAPQTAVQGIFERMAEVIAVGYKYRFLEGIVRVSMPKRERGLLLSALIAADFEGDRAYILPRLASEREYCLDALFLFRMAPLREKWERIAAYIPESFSVKDLKNFSKFLVSESRRTVYIKENKVYNEHFRPLRLSRLTGEEDLGREVVLADAGFVKCIGKPETETQTFLEKYYPDRVAFS